MTSQAAAQPRLRHSIWAKRIGIPALAAMAGLCAMQGPAPAQEAYPAKPVKIVVGMPPGSFTDVTARLMGDRLRAELGQPFLIENRPGAGTNIATAAVARSPNDGYTLLLASNSNTMNVSLFKDLPFDVVKDFQPVAMIAASHFVLVVHPSLPVTSLQELIAYAKKNPGVLNFASTGSGTANHLAVEMFAQRAGVKVATIFYKGSAEGVTDVLAGRTHGMFAPASTVLAHIKAGSLRPIAFTSTVRSPLVPDVPTLSEAGLAGYEVAMWNGLFVPAGTPPDVVERLAKAATKAVESDELQTRIKANGGQPIVMGPKEFSDYVQRDIRMWNDVIKSSGIKPQ